jgi:hypothetical protein
VSTCASLIGNSKLLKCCMRGEKKRIFKLLKVGSNRIDMSLDIQKLIKNNYLLSTFVRLNLSQEQLALLKIQKSNVLADDLFSDDYEQDNNKPYD